MQAPRIPSFLKHLTLKNFHLNQGIMIRKERREQLRKEEKITIKI